MKTLRLAIGFLFLVLVACHRPVETRHGTSLQPELAAIDTLMQTRPDSALTLLLDEPINDPFYQLLLSEALYKNDYAQANRTELLTAMTHFDSIDDPILSARCHYMNGVGYYEMDSVVSACAEYLKALEIMEEHFEEKDLVGYKAKFMALTHTHLCLVFSDQYLHEQAICFGKKALFFYNRYNAEPWHIAWLLDKVGSHYEILKITDSANYYYRSAIDILPDTNSLMYRDISSHLAFLLYEFGENKAKTLGQLYHLVDNSPEEPEKIIRYASIGAVYYLELQYDSAWKYLSKVYIETTNIRLKKQAAEWLVEICKSRSNYSEIPVYTEFLAQFAILDETQAGIKSCLTDLFLQHEKNSQKLTQKRSFTRFWKTIGMVFGCLVLILGFLGGFYLNRNKKKQLYQERQIVDLKNKWQDTKESLLKEKEATEKAIKANSFTEEPICAYILNLVKEQNFKAKIDCINYKDFALDNNQILKLRNAVNVHYGCFLKTLKERYPKLSDDDLNYCCLYLLGLREADIAALMQRSFSTVCYRSRKIRGYINSKEPLYISLNNYINTL